jgi:hypothetical protein
MLDWLRRAFDWMTPDRPAATIPSMDGALRPNQRLEDAPVLMEMDAPDNLVGDGASAYFSSGAVVYRLTSQSTNAEKVRTFEASVSSLAVDRTGTLAIGLSSGRIVMHGGSHDGTAIVDVGGRPTKCPTALAFDPSGRLVVCLGSDRHGPEDWKRDLMDVGRPSGSLWRIGTDGTSDELLADGLAYPYGLMVLSNGRFAVSESWRHRILAISTGRRPEVLLDDLPGYPARLASAGEGDGAWLAIFAPRRQLIEFVLREPALRNRMVREVDPDYWMAPALFSGRSFLEPLQGGAVKHLGILKPWAPRCSYGLVVRLDAAFQPIASYHSRADGIRHGVTSLLPLERRVLVASKGSNAILVLDPAMGDLL